MRKIILMMMLTTIAGCGERASGSKTETDAHPAKAGADAQPVQNTNFGGQFGSGAQSPEEKFAEVKQKAESGSSKDQLGLGRMYYNGVGVTKDDAKAAEWWQKAAAQGNEAAQEALRNLHANVP